MSLLYTYMNIGGAQRVRRRIAVDALAVPPHSVTSDFAFQMSAKGLATGSDLIVKESGRIIFEENLHDRNLIEISSDPRLTPGKAVEVWSTPHGTHTLVMNQIRIATNSRISTDAVITGDANALETYVKQEPFPPLKYQSVLRALWVRTFGLVISGECGEGCLRSMNPRVCSSMREAMSSDFVSRLVLRFTVDHSVLNRIDMVMLKEADSPAALLNWTQRGGVDIYDPEVLSSFIAQGHFDNVHLLIQRMQISDSCLYLAVLHRDLPIARLLIGTGRVDVNHVDFRGSTALLVAVRNGDSAMVEMLISEGATMGSTNLVHTCVLSDFLEVLDVLLKAQAPVDPWSLNIACERGNASMTKKLLEIVAVNTDTLIRAENHVECLRLCVQKAEFIERKLVLRFMRSESPHAVSRFMTLLRSPHVEIGNVANHALLRGDSFRLIEAIVKHPNFETEATFKGMTTLMWAVNNERLRVVELLIRVGAKVTAKTESNVHSVLTMAARKKNLRIVQMLVRGGALTDDTTLLSPLRCALDAGNDVIAQFILDSSEELGVIKNSLRGAPLVIAATEGDVAMVDLLLSHGADVDAFDIRGWNPALTAANKGHLELLKLLVEHEADLCATHRSTFATTPLIYACAREHDAIVEFLLGFEQVRRAYDGHSLYLAVSRRNHKLIERLVKVPIDFLNQDEFWAGKSLEYSLDNELPWASEIIDAYGTSMMQHQLLMRAADSGSDVVSRSARAALRRSS